MPNTSISATTAQHLSVLMKSARDITLRDIRVRYGYGWQATLNGNLDHSFKGEL